MKTGKTGGMMGEAMTVMQHSRANSRHRPAPMMKHPPKRISVATAMGMMKVEKGK